MNPKLPALLAAALLAGCLQPLPRTSQESYPEHETATATAFPGPPVIAVRTDPSPLPLSPAARLVERQIDAYNRLDLTAFLDTFAADACIFSFPGTDQGLCGESQVRPVYAALFSDNPEVHCRIIKRVVNGDWVVVHEHISGLAQEQDTYVIGVYEVRDDRVANVWFIY